MKKPQVSKSSAGLRRPAPPLRVPGKKRHRRQPFPWFWTGCLTMLLLAFLGPFALPMLLRHRSDSRSRAAVQMLQSLRQAEERHRAQAKSYAYLGDLQREGAIPFGDGGVDKASGYTFSILVGKEQYTLTATPPEPGMATFSMDEKGKVTE